MFLQIIQISHLQVLFGFPRLPTTKTEEVALWAFPAFRRVSFGETSPGLDRLHGENFIENKKRPQTSRAQDLLDCLDNISLCDTSNSSNDYLDGGATHEESHLGNNEFSSHITSQIYVLKYLDFTERDLLKQVRVFWAIPHCVQRKATPPQCVQRNAGSTTLRMK